MTYQFAEIPLTLFSNTEVLPNFIALCSFFFFVCIKSFSVLLLCCKDIRRY